MNIKTKQRIVGALVIVATIAIFLPLVFHAKLPGEKALEFSTNIPSPPVEPTYTASSEGVQFRFDNTNESVPPKLAAMVNPKKNQLTTQQKLKPAITIDTPPTAWVVKVATFANQSNVDELVLKLRNQGFDAYEKGTTKNNQNYIQVFVGPEIRKEKAVQIQKTMLANYKLKGVVVNYQV
ncbi:MAG: hypothetical protein A3F17_02370 [Gammaproteobacteria bacterium RIFCSPHIGHO2_12_FULL_41_15]|nr:MAG: hypothetical protein A3F17_02370 [Gammaproteobacteria bacterium RIFCSPHIGHO2_12_FULL_41_15]